MSFAVTLTRAEQGIESPLVRVEVHVAGGLPRTTLVGLAEMAVRESRERVRAAIVSSGFEYPARVYTINLAPADLSKTGGRYDLAIAVAMLAATGQISAELSAYEFVGELGLEGDIRAIRGVIPAAIASTRTHRTLVIPTGNAPEARLMDSERIVAADHLLDIARMMKGEQELAPVRRVAAPHRAPGDDPSGTLSLDDIHAQQHGKRALGIAAAGGHNLLMVGPPGSGKTMLAARLPTLLPPANPEQAIQIAAIQSLSRQPINAGTWGRRPFRNPHHSASAAAIVGGGQSPTPGEVSLAHQGVLFMDELPEFSRQVLEVLREPLESGNVIISRARYHVCYPADFQLIAAMNPCPCGYYGDKGDRCQCTDERVRAYRSKLSGPLLDRIDMHIYVPRLAFDDIAPRPSDDRLANDAPEDERSTDAPAPGTSESTSRGAQTRAHVSQANHSHAKIVTAVQRARDAQLTRQGVLNGRLAGAAIADHCALHHRDQSLLKTAMEHLGLSMRGYYKILKVARTIADIADSPAIETTHLTEAISYRRLDRERLL